MGVLVPVLKLVEFDRFHTQRHSMDPWGQRGCENGCDVLDGGTIYLLAEIGVVLYETNLGALVEPVLACRCVHTQGGTQFLNRHLRSELVDADRHVSR